MARKSIPGRNRVSWLTVSFPVAVSTARTTSLILVVPRFGPPKNHKATVTRLMNKAVRRVAVLTVRKKRPGRVNCTAA